MFEKVCVRRGKMRCEVSGKSAIGKSALAASEQNWIRPESGDTRIYYQIRCKPRGAYLGIRTAENIDLLADCVDIVPNDFLF